MRPGKSGKDDANSAEAAKNFIDKILGDVSKESATKQIVIGTASGWYVLFINSKYKLNIKVSAMNNYNLIRGG